MLLVEDGVNIPQTTRHRQELSKLHHEGRLQRILHIPIKSEFADHFPEAQSLRDASSLTRNKRPRPTTNGHAKDDSPKRARRGSPMIQAIVVDDDEVGEFDDSSDPEPLDGDDESDESDDSDVQAISPPKGKGSLKDRYQSVSEDEYGEPSSEDEDEPSRYAIKQPKVKASESAPEEEGEVESDDEIAPAKNAKVVRKGDAASRRAQGQRNRDFWAAKAGTGQADSSEEDGVMSD